MSGKEAGVRYYPRYRDVIRAARSTERGDVMVWQEWGEGTEEKALEKMMLVDRRLSDYVSVFALNRYPVSVENENESRVYGYCVWVSVIKAADFGGWEGLENKLADTSVDLFYVPRNSGRGPELQLESCNVTFPSYLATSEPLSLIVGKQQNNGRGLGQLRPERYRPKLIFGDNELLFMDELFGELAFPHGLFQNQIGPMLVATTVIERIGRAARLLELLQTFSSAPGVIYQAAECSDLVSKLTVAPFNHHGTDAVVITRKTDFSVPGGPDRLTRWGLRPNVPKFRKVKVEIVVPLAFPDLVKIVAKKSHDRRMAEFIADITPKYVTDELANME